MIASQTFAIPKTTEHLKFQSNLLYLSIRPNPSLPIKPQILQNQILRNPPQFHSNSIHNSSKLSKPQKPFSFSSLKLLIIVQKPHKIAIVYETLSSDEDLFDFAFLVVARWVTFIVDCTKIP
jgi:hypothetical protein